MLLSVGVSLRRRLRVPRVGVRRADERRPAAGARCCRARPSRRSLLEATFQFLPAFVRVSKHNPVLQTLSGPAVLLVWLYVMANVIVIGAEVNFHLRAAARRVAR